MLYASLACRHTSPEGISSGQAGHAQALETTPNGSKSLMSTAKQCRESTAVGLVNDIGNMHVQPFCQI